MSCSNANTIIPTTYYVARTVRYERIIMLRITENLENDKIVRLRLDGTISLQSFVELREVCTRHQTENRKTIIVDMSGVDFMNDEAAVKLVGLRSESLRVINCSPFIAALLETVGRLD